MMCLDGRNIFRRHFNAQIAAGDHDGVGGLQDGVQMFDGLGLFELGDDPGKAPVGGHSIAHQVDIFGRADKGDCNGIDAIFQGEIQIDIIFGGKRGHAHKNAGKVDALVFAQLASVYDLADDIVVHNLFDAQLDEAIREEDARALLNIFSKRLEGRADERRRALYFVRRDGNFFSRDKHHRYMILELGGANFGTLQVSQDAERLILLATHLADHLDQSKLLFMGAMG